LGIIVAEKRNLPKGHSQPPRWLKVLIGLFLVVFVIGGLYSGYLFYVTVRDIVANADLPAIPVVQLPSIRAPEAVAEEEIEEPEPPPVLPEMTAVPGQAELVYQPPVAPASAEERINILLVGIDRRNGESWAYRTDTMIVVTIDPVNKEAGMMSIPRDLYLTIPGLGEDRINAANPRGYSKSYPGGGPSLLKHTIETNFGIPIDYYIMIDFAGFQKGVDTLGGIEVDVPKTLHDTMYPMPKPGDPYAMGTVHFDPGPQDMDGERALQYARSRMSTSDFDRAARQQLILLAIREKALKNLNIVTKLPSLIVTMGSMVKTDMKSDEMLELAALGPQIDLSNIRQLVIQKPMVYGYRTPLGAAVQLPKWDLIHAAVADMFYSEALAPAATATPAAPLPTPTLAPDDIQDLARLAEEGARIAVQNGTSGPNFAARVAAILMEQGYQVVEFGDADRLDYPATVLVDYTGKTFTLEKLIEYFHVTPENVRHSPNLRSQIDIRIVVGQDFLTLP